MSSLEPEPEKADRLPADILRAAESIVEHQPIDWDVLERSHPGQQQLLRELKGIQAISAANRDDLPESDLASDSPDDSLGFWGPLELRAKLGQGTFGEVYRAYDPSLDREVALKLLHDSGSRSERGTTWLISEARRLARVRNPNVLVVHGAGIWRGRTGFWTDLLPGTTLEEHLVANGTLETREAVLIGIDLCRALAAVHQAGIIHRDVKPSNVMREPGGRFVLMDFGSGAELRSATARESVPSAYGTPMFMAPEQLYGSIAGAPTDIYALGVLLYRALSDQMPIDAVDLDDLMRKHRAGAAVALRDRRPDLPDGLIRAIDRAIQSDPTKRFQSAEAMERALAESLESVSVSGKKRRQHWGVLAFAVPAAIALVMASAHVLQRRPDPGPSTVGPPHPPPNRIMARAELFRQGASGDDRLLDGGSIRAGDGLYLTFEAPETLYAYVMDEDANGNFYLLFPVTGVSPANPLRASVQHRLPGSIGSKLVNWQVTSAGGEERITVLAFRSPPTELERELVNFPTAVDGRPVRGNALGKPALDMLRGISGFSVEHDGTARGRDRVAKLSEPLKREGGAWVWQIHLKNPAF